MTDFHKTTHHNSYGYNSQGKNQHFHNSTEKHNYHEEASSAENSPNSIETKHVHQTKTQISNFLIFLNKINF